MVQRHHIVHMGILGQQLILDPLDGDIKNSRHTLHTGGNAQNILDPHRTVPVPETLEGISLQRRKRLRHPGGQRQLLQLGGSGQNDIGFVDPAAPDNVAGSIPDNFPVADNGFMLFQPR
ncbi:hypothetical protein D3C76_1265970 [compost metagenome]